MYLSGGFPLLVHKYSSLLYHTPALPSLFQPRLPKIAEVTPQAESRKTTFAGIMDVLNQLREETFHPLQARLKLITAELCKNVSHQQEVTGIDIKRLSSYTHEYDNCFTLSYNKGIIATEENVNSFI